MLELYGIKNCDTAGIDARTLERWCREVGWEALLNRSARHFASFRRTRKSISMSAARVFDRATVAHQATRARDRRARARRGAIENVNRSIPGKSLKNGSTTG
jgi:hypothetical protein